MALDPAYAALDQWVEDVMGRHEVRRVLRDLKLAELEMLLTVIQKSAPSGTGSRPLADRIEKRG
ncbi:MAG: hypothetical protein ACFB6R_17210 [Alphaproteobacteria bacterium]